MSTLCRVSGSIPDLGATPKGTVRFPRIHHSLLQACIRSDSATMYEVPRYHGFYRRLQVLGQQQLKKAIYQSFEQELQPDVQSIEKLGQEVKDEIALAAALAECQDQQLQTMERQAASKDRSRLRAFIPKVEVNLREMKEMHIQQSSRISSSYFLVA